MEGEEFYGAAYKGTKQFTQKEVKTANATGFGAAADDYMERGIDLNEQLVHNKPATYFFRMKGDAMQEAGIFDGDILIVDRSLKLVNGKIITEHFPPIPEFERIGRVTKCCIIIRFIIHRIGSIILENIFINAILERMLETKPWIE